MRSRLFSVYIILVGLLPLTSWATIGQNVLSINVDASKFNAQVTRYDYDEYQVYQLTPTNTNLDSSYIKEYLDPQNNVVFAVSWHNINYDAAEIVLGGYLMQAEDLVGDQQNKFDYNVGGTYNNYNGYFIINYYVPQSIDINQIK